MARTRQNAGKYWRKGAARGTGDESSARAGQKGSTTCSLPPRQQGVARNSQVSEEHGIALEEDALSKCVKNVPKVLRAEEGISVTKVLEKAVEALQEAAEDLMFRLFKDMVLLMEHANHKTVKPKHLHLAIRMPGYHKRVLGYWKKGGPRD